MATNVSYSVYLNYPSRRNEAEKGIAVDFRTDLLRTLHTREDALNFARTRDLRPADYIYVYEGSGRLTRPIFYRNTQKEDLII